MKNARLFVAIITSLIDEALIVAAIIWGLPKLGVAIPLWGIILICVLFVIYCVTFYLIGSQILRKKAIPGFTEMVGTEGRTVNRLAPKGYVKIASELWDAKAERGTINSGVDVIVVDQYGLKLVVRPKTGGITY
jgi:membrane-bound ClpP family serine protease